MHINPIYNKGTYFIVQQLMFILYVKTYTTSGQNYITSCSLSMFNFQCVWIWTFLEFIIFLCWLGTWRAGGSDWLNTFSVNTFLFENTFSSKFGHITTRNTFPAVIPATPWTFVTWLGFVFQFTTFNGRFLTFKIIKGIIIFFHSL